MTNITNNSIDNDKTKAEQELIQTIEEFLEISNSTYHKENIADYVYFFFAPHGVDNGTKVFSRAAASALCIFSTSKKIRNHIKKIYGIDFNFLCELLQKVVEFCSSIRSEANLARLDKSRWRCGDNSHLSLQDVIDEKNKYENKVNILRDRIQRGKRS